MRAAKFRHREIGLPAPRNCVRQAKPRRLSGRVRRGEENGEILLWQGRRAMLIDRMNHKLDHMAIHDRDDQDILETLETCLEGHMTGASVRD